MIIYKQFAKETEIHKMVGSVMEVQDVRCENCEQFHAPALFVYDGSKYRADESGFLKVGDTFVVLGKSEVYPNFYFKVLFGGQVCLIEFEEAEDKCRFIK